MNYKPKILKKYLKLYKLKDINTKRKFYFYLWQAVEYILCYCGLYYRGKKYS